MIGIYKITSPSSKVYIGQSWEIAKRWKHYKYVHCLEYGRQRGIFNSMRKYGYESHKFELIHEMPTDVDQNTMNVFEQLYMDFYSAAGIKLLNCKEAAANGKLSTTTKALIIRSLTGRKNSKETIAKRAASITGRPVSAETRGKISAANSGRPLSDKRKAEVGKFWKGAVRTEQNRINVSNGLKGISKSEDHKRNLSVSRIRNGSAKGANNPKAKLNEQAVREIRTKYRSGIPAKELRAEYNMSKSGLHSLLSGINWSHVA